MTTNIYVLKLKSNKFYVGKSFNPSKSSSNKCFKCGHNGHYSSNCYASKHKKGYYIDSDSD